MTTYNVVQQPHFLGQQGGHLNVPILDFIGAKNDGQSPSLLSAL